MKIVISILTLCALIALGVIILKPRPFKPNVPIIPLYATEDEARRLLEQWSPVSVEEPEDESRTSQRVLVASNSETRIDVGIWNGRVRFTNYLTDQFNRTDRQRSRKLNWFLDQLGGKEEFEEPNDTGYMLFIRNPKRKLMVVYGLHLGPIRINDQNPAHWGEEDDKEEGEDEAAKSQER
ncbi:hypothetical protein [Verrucomicrobium sp. BvORR106]|uniref:hypothetical protein n=1 Tax=Verrucomicrobium sp. BvORR106 TaxID=1403819 RepID=UPI0005712430|nr:hypothetical protein [Verrucomicrobium sp. BvORR106]